jgi:hypothetical protein
MPVRGFVDDTGAEIPWTDVLAGKGAFMRFPRSFVRALARKQYEKYSDLHASFVANGLVQQEMLKRRHDYFVRVYDELYTADGTALHMMVEAYADPGEAVKKRYVVKHRTGLTVGGTFDKLDIEVHGNRKILWEVKRSSVFKTKAIMQNGVVGGAIDWARQLNLYRWLIVTAPDSEFLGQLSGWELRVFLFTKDWRAFEYEQVRAAMKAKTAYPEEQADTFPVQVEEIEAVEGWVDMVCDEWQKNVSLPDDKLCTCPVGELWGVTRDGWPKRCAKYCEVSRFCKQYERTKAQILEERAAMSGSEPVQEGESESPKPKGKGRGRA